MHKTFLLFLLLSGTAMMNAQVANTYEENRENWPEHEYNLTIEKQMVNFTGKDIEAMTVNGGIPGPNLVFTEGEYAVIHVTNKMDVETSVHWHGLILPNYYDGVPYLSTPPIKPGETFTYKFALKQSGTYWYHSHTMLQEQRGVFGTIQINPKDKTLDYDKDLVIALSDWMDEDPSAQLKNLKRGNEWYLIKKGQIQSWDKIIKHKAVGAKLKMIWERMPDMAISDNLYDKFLINGASTREYPDFKPGEKVRLRFVNASAATYFWLTFGGEDPLLVSADGQDVVPVRHNKTLIGVAETYDYIVTVPENGKLEIRATAQDGSGFATAYVSNGPVLKAPVVPKPDLIKLMKELMAMDMKMGAPASKFNPSQNDSIKYMKKYSMDPPAGRAGMGKMDMKSDKMDMDMDGQQMDEMQKGMKTDSTMAMNGMNDSDEMEEGMGMNMQNDSTKMTMKNMGSSQTKMKNRKMKRGGMNMGYTVPADQVIGDNMKTGGNPEFNYDYLKSPVKTTFSGDKPVREMLFNLTGNMNRYVWSINGVPLSETDKIKIKQGEVVRITLNNLTMMHHPMHLHGHFFRVLNKNGDYSPLKHTVDVAPMQKVVIEFDARETGDWFFHCHILYHLNAGMARVFSYGGDRDKRLKDFPLANLTTEANHMFTWGELTAASHKTELYATATNIRNQFTFRGEYGWNKNLEGELTYERYLNDYFRVFGGVNVENGKSESYDDIETTAIAGVRYLMPLLINADVRLDSKLRPQIRLSKATMIFPHILLYGEYEYQADFGWVNDFAPESDYEKETTWQVGLEYILGRDLSLTGSYDNRFGAGGGLSLRF